MTGPYICRWVTGKADRITAFILIRIVLRSIGSINISVIALLPRDSIEL